MQIAYIIQFNYSRTAVTLDFVCLITVSFVLPGLS